jgi:DNA-binding CsgD family transcriptional regulator
MRSGSTPDSMIEIEAVYRIVSEIRSGKSCAEAASVLGIKANDIAAVCRVVKQKTHQKSDQRAAKIAEMAKSGSTAREIATALHVTKSNVLNSLKRQGIRARWPSYPSPFKKDFSRIDWSLPMVQIAKQLGISKQRVHQIKQAELAVTK